MNFEEALEFIENLVYTKTGKHLNDLERKVFVGSWQGHTYEHIYPINPEYVEKDVGYKLWQKLSSVLDDKVTKKKVQGAIKRAIARQELLQAESLDRRFQPEPINETSERFPETRRVFISYCSQEPDLSLAVELSQGIAAAGHQVFMANIGAVYSHQKSVKDCLSQINVQLEQCEYFLLLLSEQTAVSEIVIEELRRIKKMRDCRQKPEPMVLPIRVNYPASIPLNHDLRNYINDTRHREWKSPKETGLLLQEINYLLSQTVTIKGNIQSTGTATIDTDDDISAGFVVNLNLLSPKDISPKYVANTVTISRTLPLSNPPSPAAEPELPQGQVRLDSAFYVDRVPFAQNIAHFPRENSGFSGSQKDIEKSLDRLLKNAPTEAGIYGDHLRRHLWNLQEHPELGVAFCKVVTANEPVELESVLAFKLHSLGLVQLRGNEVTVGFELYRQYFSDRLKSI